MVSLARRKQASTGPAEKPGPAPGSDDPAKRSRWWQIRWFRGMHHDLRRRLPWYLSDWTDAWDYRVLPATVYIYCTNILPALAFSLDMYENTDRSYGVSEVLFASVLASAVFSLFAAQPLVIVGVTGPIAVFNYTVYDILASREQGRAGPLEQDRYLSFMAWIGLWSLLLHSLLAASNSCVALRWVTKFPCDAFGLFVAVVYIEKGVEVLIRQFPGSGSALASSLTDAGGFLSVVLALATFIIADTLARSFAGSSLFRPPARKFVQDYALPATVVLLSGMAHVGRLGRVDLQYLPTTTRGSATDSAFQPTLGPADRPNGWVIPFWRLPAADVFLALPFAILLTALFWFDHNVSSLMAQEAGAFPPLKKPAGFHWDLFLLGITTGLTGILGLPFPNGLIPQAPFHTAALSVWDEPAPPRTAALSSSSSDNPEKAEGSILISHDGGGGGGSAATATGRVVEQRLSNLAQGLITLFTQSPPALVALGKIPESILGGLFFVMAFQALRENGTVRALADILSGVPVSVPGPSTSPGQPGPHTPAASTTGPDTDPDPAGTTTQRRPASSPSAPPSSSSPPPAPAPAPAPAPSPSQSPSPPPLPRSLLNHARATLTLTTILFVALTFALTHTVAAIGFPLLFALLIPARHVRWGLPACVRLGCAVGERLDRLRDRHRRRRRRRVRHLHPHQPGQLSAGDVEASPPLTPTPAHSRSRQELVEAALDQLDGPIAAPVTMEGVYVD